MQPKTLLVLSAVVLVLGAFIFFYEKDLPSTDERAELAKKVLRLEEDAVQALSIEWDETSVRLERQRPSQPEEGEGEESTTISSDGWRLVSPLDGRADRVAVEGLVSSLVELESSRSFEDFDRGELGLDEPRARVTIHTEDGDSVLEIGAELPATSDMVVAVGGASKAYRVASTIFGNLTQEPGDWRDKKLFTGLRSDIDRVTLSSTIDEASEKVLLAKRGEDFWIESPLTDRADGEQISTLMTELTGLQVETFLDEPLLTPESLGLEPPQAVLEAVLAGQESPFRLELGAATETEGTFYGRVDAQLFEVKTQLPDLLSLPAPDWRSRAWTAQQVFKIESARFEDAEGTLAVQRDGADWKRGDDRVGYSVVSDLLYPITEVKGERVLEREQAMAEGHSLENASLKITLSTQKQAESTDGEATPAEDLTLFPLVDGFAAATSGDRQAVLLLSEAEVVEILEHLQELRSAEALPDEEAESTGGEDAEEAGGE